MNAKQLTEPFTMTEYIEFHRLNVSPYDAGRTRVISKHLKEEGYRQRKVRRNRKIVLGWLREPRPTEKELKDALKGIK